MHQALSQDPDNPDVYQTFASVRISQCNIPQATTLLCTGMDLWFKEPQDNSPLLPLPDWPAYNSRLGLARLLLEVEQYDRALMAIQSCMVENDEDADVWYLFGFCYYTMVMSSEVHDDKQEIITDSKECFSRVLQVLQLTQLAEQFDVDPEMAGHASSLLQELQDLN